ncbi:MAG: NAD(P)/FAD-dependent oxidoreductase, partial [Pseudomonas sp.]
MTSPASKSKSSVAIIGGGPAGLMAAEVLSQAGIRVDLYDAMPSVGRKFLLAGVGGMNITHSEPYPAFLSRYAERAPQIAPMLRSFGAEQLC